MGEDRYITLPNFLIPYRDGGVEDYTDAPETVGRIVLAVASKLFARRDISESLSPCERGVYRHWLKVAEEGLEKAANERGKMRKLAAARWGKETGGAPSPAPVVRPASGGYHEIKTPAPRPAVKPSGVPAQGGACKSFGDVIGGGGLSALFGGAGGGMADKIAANPVAAALEITGETGNKLSAGALNKYLRTKGAGAFTDTVFAFYSELKNGEEVGNRGAALNARLRDLPDIPKGAGK